MEYQQPKLRIIDSFAEKATIRLPPYSFLKLPFCIAILYIIKYINPLIFYSYAKREAPPQSFSSF